MKRAAILVLALGWAGSASAQTVLAPGLYQVQGPPSPAVVTLTTAPTGQAGQYTVTGNDIQPSSWVNLKVDGQFVSSSNGAPWSWTQQLAPGSHALEVDGYHGSGVPDGSARQTLSVPPLPANIAPAATLAGITGSGASIGGADTDPSHYGAYNASGGQMPATTSLPMDHLLYPPKPKVNIAGAGVGLIGGPLLDDITASQFVVPTIPSSVEQGPTGLANQALNNYYEMIVSTNQGSAYQAQLQQFWSAWGSNNWGGVINRIDGACPIANPTTAEVMQWAANKWGINPLLAYAEATHDGDWDQTTLGDGGTSSGVTQVADLNTSTRPYHAFNGFTGLAANLSRENTCFSADFWAGHLYAAFHGLTGECAGKTLDIGGAIQTWADGSGTCGSGNYTTIMYNSITSQDWVKRFFGGTALPVPTASARTAARTERPMVR